MNHGHADEDFGVVVASLLFPDIERPQPAFAGLEVKEKAVEVAQKVSDRVEQLRDRFEKWRGQRTGDAEQRLDTQPRSPAQEPKAAQERQRGAPELGVDARIESGREAFRERYEAYQRERQPAVPEVQPEPKQEPAQALEKGQEQEIKIERGFGLGM